MDNPSNAPTADPETPVEASSGPRKVLYLQAVPNPNEKTIELLSELLEMAKEGKIRSLIATIEDDSHYQTVWSNVEDVAKRIGMAQFSVFRAAGVVREDMLNILDGSG